MNSRTSSISHPLAQASRRPSYSSRISSVLSTADREAAVSGAVEHQIDEEIEEIKRYEVGSSILDFDNGVLLIRAGFYYYRYALFALRSLVVMIAIRAERREKIERRRMANDW
jgi:hypothetical protein